MVLYPSIGATGSGIRDHGRPDALAARTGNALDIEHVIGTGIL